MMLAKELLQYLLIIDDMDGRKTQYTSFYQFIIQYGSFRRIILLRKAEFLKIITKHFEIKSTLSEWLNL